MSLSAERLEDLKQSPRSANVTDVEDLCDEVERLRAEMKLNGRGKREYLIFFLGFITMDITELLNVNRDQLFAAVDRFLETMKGEPK
jgi:hypothetical protein